MAAQLEEVGVEADVLGALDAQGLGEEAGQELLGERARRPARRLRQEVGGGPRERAAVHLAARGERQRVAEDEIAGDHVVRQLALQGIAQRGGGQGGPCEGDDMGDQAAAAG